jgi:hypothetical protein
VARGIINGMEAKKIYSGRHLAIFEVQSNTPLSEKRSYRKKTETYRVFFNSNKWSCECEGWENFFEGKECTHILECISLFRLQRNTKKAVQINEKVIQKRKKPTKH